MNLFPPSFRSLILAWLIILIGGTLDLLVKLWMSHLLIMEPLPILPFFRLFLVHNQGASFGLFQHHSLAYILLTLIAFLFLVWASFWSFKLRGKIGMELWGIGLIGAGAWGNGLERLLTTRVTDYLDFYWQGYHFPTFNLADIWINLGVLLVAWSAYRDFKRTKAVVEPAKPTEPAN